MADKRSDVFNKPTTDKEVSDAHVQHNKNADAARQHAEAAKPTLTKPEPLDVRDDRNPTETRVGLTKPPVNEDKDEYNPTTVKVGHTLDVSPKQKAREPEDMEFTFGKHKYHTWPIGSIPIGVWGLAVWSRHEGSQEYLAFLDNKGDWWWATTTGQNGVNPAVEKTEEPVGWRAL